MAIRVHHGVGGARGHRPGGVSRLIDSIFSTVDTAEDEALGDATDRTVVGLAGFTPVTAPDVAAIATADSVLEIAPMLRLGAELAAGGESFAVIVELVELVDGLWHPSLVDGAVTSEPRLILAAEAAADLGVDVDDTVVCVIRSGPGSPTFSFMGGRSFVDPRDDPAGDGANLHFGRPSGESFLACLQLAHADETGP